MRRSNLTFLPSNQSYGAEEMPEEEVSTAENVTAWMPAIKSALGLDDPRKAVVTYENRLRDLQSGTPPEKAAAMMAAGAFTLSGAISKTERKLEEAQAAAFQTRTRDALYTALTITGVVSGSALALFLATKTYATYLDTKR